jgi:hypothetical protein
VVEVVEVEELIMRQIVQVLTEDQVVVQLGIMDILAALVYRGKVILVQAPPVEILVPAAVEVPAVLVMVMLAAMRGVVEEVVHIQVQQLLMPAAAVVVHILASQLPILEDRVGVVTDNCISAQM